MASFGYNSSRTFFAYMTHCSTKRRHCFVGLETICLFVFFLFICLILMAVHEVTMVTWSVTFYLCMAEDAVTDYKEIILSLGSLIICHFIYDICCTRPKLILQKITLNFYNHTLDPFLMIFHPSDRSC